MTNNAIIALDSACPPPPLPSMCSDNSVALPAAAAGLIATSSSPEMTTTATTSTSRTTTTTTADSSMQDDKSSSNSDSTTTATTIASSSSNNEGSSRQLQSSQPKTLSLPTITMTPSREYGYKSTSTSTIASGVNLVELYSPVKAARTVMQRKRRRWAADDAIGDGNEEEKEMAGEEEVGIRFVVGMTPPTMTPMAIPSSSSLETTANNNNNNIATPARKRLSLRSTNHITPITTTSTASASSGARHGGTMSRSNNHNGDSRNKTWRIKIGGSPSITFQEDVITPPQEWMCQSCCSGGSIPSLAEACDKCRRKGYSSHAPSRATTTSSSNNIASAVTPTRGGAGISEGGGGGEEALEIEMLDGDFDWSENEIDRAQMWQREHYLQTSSLVESGGEEEEENVLHTTSTAAAPSQTLPTNKMKNDGMGTIKDFKAMLPEENKEDSGGPMMLSQLSNSSGGSSSSKDEKRKKKKKKKQRPPTHLPSTILSQQQLIQYPIVHTNNATSTTIKMEHLPHSSSSSSNQLLNHTIIQNITQPFILYDVNDDEHINAVHNIVRRDIWEGFVVGGVEFGLPNNTTSSISTSTPATIGNDVINSSEEKGGGATPAAESDTAVTLTTAEGDNRSSSRLERYVGTIGFRCRFCKCAPASKRAEKSAVYPRSLERIYLSNIRFQRDHILQCTYIPKEISELYTRLKLSKGVTRGKKKYWVTSAIQRGLCNGENGIVFSQRVA